MNQRPTPPVPTSVSEEAQRFLATPMADNIDDTPALDDLDGWLEWVKVGEAGLIERFGGFGGAPEDIEIRIEMRRFLDRLRRT